MDSYMVCKLIRTAQKSFKFVMLFCLLSLRSNETEVVVPAQWVIWNIGQGSWLTRIEKRQCHHFDAGGEGRFPFQVVRLCRNFQNTIAISHSDWDHISFVRQLAAQFPNLCRQGPYDRTPSKFLAKIPECKSVPWWEWHPRKKLKKSNDASSVYYFRNLLYPGDSPKRFEKSWFSELPAQPDVLVLSHHGSRTGTSMRLLKDLPKLRVAIASARKNKYGHPHALVVERLRRLKIPLLTTQNWGSIHIMDEAH
jgi:competence protein ComEC